MNYLIIPSRPIPPVLSFPLLPNSFIGPSKCILIRISQSHAPQSTASPAQPSKAASTRSSASDLFFLFGKEKKIRKSLCTPFYLASESPHQKPNTRIPSLIPKTALVFVIVIDRAITKQQQRLTSPLFHSPLATVQSLANRRQRPQFLARNTVFGVGRQTRKAAYAAQPLLSGVAFLFVVAVLLA